MGIYSFWMLGVYCVRRMRNDRIWRRTRSAQALTGPLEHLVTEQPKCELKHASSIPKLTDLTYVVQLACDALVRSKAEHAALIRLAHEIDAQVNRLSMSNRFMFDDFGNRRYEWSRLETLVMETMSNE